MGNDCEIVGTVEKKSPIGGPPSKKLKQSRLPFAPVNTKSPKQTETASLNEKKRKLSGDDDSSYVNKTPRSESKQANLEVADENKQTPKATKKASAGETNLKSPKTVNEASARTPTSASAKVTEEKDDQVPKKKGRPLGSKNKATNSDQMSGKNLKNSDESPVARKRGRRSGSMKKSNSSSSALDKSDDRLSNSPQGIRNDDVEEDSDCNENTIKDADEQDDSCIEEEKGNEVKSNNRAREEDDTANVKSPSNSKDSEGMLNKKEAEKTDEKKHKEEKSTKSKTDKELLMFEKGSDKTEKETSSKNENDSSSNSEIETSSKDSNEESSKNDNPVDHDRANQGEATRKRGRPKGTSLKRSLTPQGEENPKKKPGRPFGAKNVPKDGKKNNLNKSSCSITSDEEGSSRSSKTPEVSKKKNAVDKTRSLLSLFACKPQIKDANSSPGETSEAKKSLPDSEVTKSSPTDDLNAVKSSPTTSSQDVESNVVSNDVKSSNDCKETNKEIGKDESEVKQTECNKDIKDESDGENDDENSRILFSLEGITEKEGNKEDRREINTAESKGKKDSMKVSKFNKVECFSKTVEKSKEAKNNLDISTDSSQPREGLNESTSEMEVSACESETNTSRTMSPGSSSDANSSALGSLIKTPTSAGPKTKLFTKPRKLTPSQKEKEAAKLLRMEERAKQKEEKEKQLQEKMAEKERLRIQKEEEKKQKEEEKQKQKEEREKVKEELRKKKQEEIDAKKMKKVEETQRKEEERLKKEEENLRKEEEKIKHKDMLKKKFASFFVEKKKRETDDDVMESDGPFQEFQVKEDMQLAPVVRQKLTESKYAELDEYVSGTQEDPLKTYLQILKSGTYVACKYKRTLPIKKKVELEDEDDILIIEDEDEEDIGDVIQNPTAVVNKGQSHKAKLLSFCENRRPAYWGTWSKKSAVVSARKPLAKDEIFDYDYDSDDDWEEEEAGESLSDSEGDDKEEKDEGDQYEVDNDFFVPHGYLSDDEGKSDQEEDEDEEPANKNEETEHSRNTEQLKLKQAEFEEEMKKKTKELKPRVIGCLWMADENNNPAYNQLMKILGPHRAVTLCSQRPISTSYSRGKTMENKDVELDDDTAADYRLGNSKKFVKTFPEEAIPALIKLLHGNRHGKGKLCREFGDYWRKLTAGELEANQINPTPNPTLTGKSVHIAKRKVDSKIQEIGIWKRQLDTSTSRYVMCWYVPKKTREEHGFNDLDFPNSWIYINKPTRKDEVDDDDVDSPKVGKMRPITAFTKKMSTTPSSTNSSPVSSTNTTPQCASEIGETPTKSTNDTPVLSVKKGAEFSGQTPHTANKKNSSLSTPTSTPGTPTSSQSSVKNSWKKKVNLFPSKTPESSGPKRGSIVSFFKKSKDGSSPSTLSTSCSKQESEDNTKRERLTKADDDFNIIVLD